MSTPWKTVRLFISSTFRDMQAERDWLVRFVFPRLREELLKHRIHFIDVDLRWGVTSDEDAIEACRQIIGECRPRFMCMLGGRYGYVPTGMKCSITADEIEFGVLNPPPHEHGPVRAFFYFRHESATARMVEEKAGDYCEPVGSHTAAALAKLKKTITEAGHAPRTYGESAQWDAAAKRLIGLEEFGNRVHDDVLQSLKDDPTLAERFADSSIPRDEFAEERDAMEAFVEERTDRYVVGSREPLLREVLAFATADAAPNIFVITGEAGTGKSAFLAKLTHELPSSLSKLSAQPSTVIPHFIGASAGSTDLRRTLRRLCHELARAAGNAEPLPLDLKELIVHFQKLLAEAGAKGRVILIFDALDQFDATDGAHWLNWLPRELLPGVHVIASVVAPAEAQPEHQTLAILRNRPGTRIEKLGQLTEADTLTIIKGYLTRYAKRLSPEQLAALLAKPMSRLPLYVLIALEELRTLGTHREITARIHELPGDVRALFGWILTERLARDTGFRDREGQPCGTSLVEKFAACLGVSRHGLSPVELTALLDPGDPLGNVAALLRLLRPYLMHRGELLDFYHGQFREAAAAAYLDTPEKQRSAHQSVATCLQAFADPHRDGQCRDATPHSLSELPHHQTRAEAWPDLIATLENIFFLEAKVTHGMAFDLVSDFADATTMVPQEYPGRRVMFLLEEAVRREIHSIGRHPETLFQRIWSLCWWFDSPLAANSYEAPRGGWDGGRAPWEMNGQKLFNLMDRWSEQKRAYPGIQLQPKETYAPSVPLGTALKAELLGHTSHVLRLAYSADGKRLASGGGYSDGTIRLWNVLTTEQICAITTDGEAVTALVFDDTGTRLAARTFGGLWVWRGPSWHQELQLNVRDRRCGGIIFVGNTECIVFGAPNGEVVIMQIANAMNASILVRLEAEPTALACSPDGRTLAVGDIAGRVLVVDIASRIVRFALDNDLGMAATRIAFNNRGDKLYVLRTQQGLDRWDLHSGSLLQSKRFSFEFSPTDFVILDDRETVLFADLNGDVWAVKSTSNENMTDFRFSIGNDTCSLAFRSDGLEVASGHGDGKIWLLDTHAKISPPTLRQVPRSNTGSS